MAARRQVVLSTAALAAGRALANPAVDWPTAAPGASGLRTGAAARLVVQ